LPTPGERACVTPCCFRVSQAKLSSERFQATNSETRLSLKGRGQVLADWIFPGTCHSQRIAEQPTAAITAAGHQQVLVTVRLMRSRFWARCTISGAWTSSSYMGRPYAQGLIARIPRTRRWQDINYGRNVMGNTMYLREHHLPNVHAGVVH
jgi:hypothetical protein